MTPERWQKIEDVFHAARTRSSPEERSQFLHEACANDSQLLKEVEALLNAEERAGDFINTTALRVAAGSIAGDRPAQMEGQTIGHYQVLSSIGAGGMGEIYLATDMRTRRRVALKLLRDYFGHNAQRARRFKQEARAVLLLNHPNIVTVYDIGEEDQWQYIASEYVEGVTLRQRLKTSSLTMAEAVEIAEQISAALTAAHAAGVVHRDIKPENIMLRPDGYVKVLDFGIAKLAEKPTIDQRSSTLDIKTDPGIVMGTITYMSPEQARGLAVDERTDLFSLGVVLYEMIAGRPPFSGTTSSDTLAAILNQSPTSLAHYEPAVPEELLTLVANALRKDRAQRYQTASELLTDLRELKRLLDVQGQGPSRGTRESNTNNSRTIPTEGTQPVPGTDQSVRGRTTGTTEYLIEEVKRHKSVALASLISVLALIAFGGLTISRLTNRGARLSPFETMNVNRLSTSGNAVVAAVAPDGRYAAYVLDEADGQSLWVKQVATSATLQIIPPVNITYEGLTFSHDGSYLYCFRWDKSKTDTELLKVPTLGGVAQHLPVVPGSTIAFAPDGSQFAFIEIHSSVGKSLLVVANADGSEAHELAIRQQPDFFVAFPGTPAWSPDGKTIACAVGTSDAAGQYVQLTGVQTNDRNQRRLGTQRWASVRHLAWLADGTGLVVTGRQHLSEPMQIWRLDLASDQITRVTNDLSDYSGVSLTLDGHALVTVIDSQVTNISVGPAADPSQAERIASEAGDMEDLAWLPDGHLIYRSRAAGGPDIWMMNRDGTNKRQLTVNASTLFGVSASPDGRYIVFASDRAGHFNLWRLRLSDLELKQLTGGDGELNPDCSSDGQWVVYQHGYSLVKPTLWRVPLEGGTPVALTDGYAAWPATSPDGRLIAFNYLDIGQKQRWAVQIVSASGGALVKQLPIAPVETKVLRWTPDAKGIAYVDHRNGEFNVWEQPLNDGPAKQLTNFKGELIGSFAWSHDGKQFAVMHSTVTQDVVLINDLK
ncbi:MAG TPA: protein kinase [Pyrinomonadaceae bacterium]|nr:protein kinase [Pyrinomonadaceae bacterium]